MAKTKSKKLTNQEIFEALINKQLEPFNVTYNEAMENRNWLAEYFTTEEKSKEWREWGIKFIMEHTTSSILRQKKWAEREMIMIDLGWGLSIKKHGN